MNARPTIARLNACRARSSSLAMWCESEGIRALPSEVIEAEPTTACPEGYSTRALRKVEFLPFAAVWRFSAAGRAGLPNR